MVFADDDHVFQIPGRWDDSRYYHGSDEEDGGNGIDRSVVPNDD